MVGGISSDGAMRLGALRGKLTMLEIACWRYERRGRLRLDRLIIEHGAELSLPELCDHLAGDCPKRQSVSYYDRCGVHFPQLPELFMQRGTPRD